MDPIFLCELAETLGKTVSQLGEEMSAHELTVVWPLYFSYKHKMQRKQQDKEEQRAKRRF